MDAQDRKDRETLLQYSAKSILNHLGDGIETHDPLDILSRIMESEFRSSKDQSFKDVVASWLRQYNSWKS